MAKTTSKKRKSTVKDNGTEPLSTFQRPVTGRKDNTPAASSKTNGKQKTVADPDPKIHIEKVKLIKGETLKIGYSRIEDDATTTSIDEVHKAPVHPDMKNAFKSMAIHLGLLCDYISTQQVKDISKYNPELVEKFVVTGLSIGGGDDEQGIVLTGHKLTKAGKAVILNSPFTRFEEADETAYKYMEHLEKRKDHVISEVHLYLGGKRGEDPQGSLDFPDEEKYGDERDDFTAGEAN